MGGRIVKKEPGNRLPFPIIGKIKCGMKSDRGLPMSVDYFIATDKYAGLFNQAYGEKPQTIRIVFPSDDAEQVCKEEYEYRDDAGKVIATGDGETFKVWNGEKYVAYCIDQYPDIMEWVKENFASKMGWKVTLTLNFIIPEVRGVMGCWQYQTKGSASSIPGVRDAFDAVLETNGKVKGVVFDLSVKFAKSQKPGQNNRFPVVSLTANESKENLEKITAARKPIMLEE